MPNEGLLTPNNAAILYSDIKDSTVIAAALGDESYTSQMRSPHLMVLEDEIGRHEGGIWQDKGDGVIAYFPNTALTVTAAVTLQTRLRLNPQTATDENGDKHQVRVRMGLHTGKATDEKKPGVNALNYASRIEALADVEQIILSEAAYKAYVEETVSPYPCKHWPKRFLKGINTLESVYELDYDNVLRPEPGTRFLPNAYKEADNTYIEREQKEAEVIQAFETSRKGSGRIRLVTLHAEGGMGKTRMAITCAKRMAGMFPQGVYFVSLANTARNSQSVAASIAASLKLSQLTEDYLKSYLRQQGGMLLILDNVESVHCKKVQWLISDLLGTAPELCLLATGREEVGIEDAEECISLEEGLSPDQARDLFLDRAAMRNRRNAPRADDPALPCLLNLTEYIPLAVELLAAWWYKPYTTLAEMQADYVRDAQGALTRTLPNTSRSDDASTKHRHHTLLHSLNWSWKNLGSLEGGEEAKRVFGAISLFASHFDKTGVNAVTQQENSQPALNCLLAASLIRKYKGATRTRYTLHRFTRDYAQKKLAELFTADEIHIMQQQHDQHFQYFLTLAEEAVPFVKGADPQKKVEQLEAEIDNLSAALEWCAEHDVVRGLRVATALWHFWWRRGYARTGMERIVLLLNHADSSLPEWAEAALVAGHLSRHIGEYTQAKVFFNESLDAFKRNNNLSGAARVLRQLGVLAWNQHQWDAARLFIDEALITSQQSGKPEDIAETYYELGNLRRYQSRYDEAAQYLNDSLTFFRQAGDMRWTGTALLALGNVTVRLEDLDTARAYYAESLTLFDTIKDKGRLALIIERIAAYARLRGRFSQAAVLIGVAEKLRSDIGTPLPGPDGKEYFDELIAGLKQELGEADYIRFREQGRSLSLEEAVRRAAQEVEQRPGQ